MTYTIAKTFRFDASHKLEGLPEGHPCGRLHGHSYRVELILVAMLLDDHGFVVDYGDLNQFKVYIDDNLDHQHLNDVFPGMNPTAELIAEHLFFVAHDQMGRWGQYVDAVRVSETDKTWAEYRHVG